MRLPSVIRSVLIIVVLAAALITVSPAIGGSRVDGGVSSGGGKFAPATPLSEFLVMPVQGGYAAAGTSMRNLGRGTISLWNIPPHSTVERAFLYWNILGTNKPRREYAQGVFNDTPITGTLAASGETPCWGNPAAVESYTYRAEVTDLLRST